MIARKANRPSFTQKYQREKFSVRARNFSIALGEKTSLMGILNITPDSFSKDGVLKKYGYDVQKNIEAAQRIIHAGANIIDIGGESTRPNSQPISEHEELKRIIPTINTLAKKIKIPISVDTYKETVAQHALDNGASIINNIMGTKITKQFLQMVKSYSAAIVLMHMRGTPQTMQKKTNYTNLISEIIVELQKSIEKCLEAGIKSDRIIIDPGIGFAKTADQNFEILKKLGEFKTLKQPILIGTSRKSFIGKILGNDADERLFGTMATVCSSILSGAHIVRVHDVKAVHDAAQVTDAILNANGSAN